MGTWLIMLLALVWLYFQVRHVLYLRHVQERLEAYTTKR